MKHTIIAIIGALLPAIPCIAQEKAIDFESDRGIKALGVYDCWENSPFRDGRLKGNVKIVDNPDTLNNASAKALGAQRSRYGSNTFGVRIDLAEPFELTRETKYVHVLLHRPVSGRVMLVGLGHFRDYKDQGNYVEQFWELSSSDIEPGKWGDAVFAIKGSGDIDINSLVVVPECESPHNLPDDYLFYIDEIVVNDSPAPRTITEDYPIWAGEKESTVIDHNLGRITRSVGIATAAGEQTIATRQPDDRLLYHLIADRRLRVKAGEKIRPVIDASGSGLSYALFFDRGNDGRFDAGDLIGRWNAETGKAPEYTIPAAMKPGVYRLRFVADTARPDAAGSADAHGNTATNGGSITDVMLNIYGDEITVNDHQLNGEVLAADGRKLNALKVPSAREFRIRMNPEAGFTHRGLTLTSGYLDGDSIVHGNPQYITVVIPPFEGDEYVIPAEYTDGNLLINGHMTEVGRKD